MITNEKLKIREAVMLQRQSLESIELNLKQIASMSKNMNAALHMAK